MKLFLSFNKHDLPIARWIAFTAESSGCEVLFQEWDFAPGTDFVHQMRVGLGASDKLIAVLSPAYLEALFTHPEWHHFFRRDPTGSEGLILPIRVADCDPGPLLDTRIYLDFVGRTPRECRQLLLAALKGERRKPNRHPPFPLQPAFPLASVAPPTDWLTSLLSANSALEALANVYHRACPQRDQLVALPVNADAWARHLRLRKQLQSKLGVDARLVLLRVDQVISHLRVASEAEALAALLAALSSACRERVYEQGAHTIQTSRHLGAVAYQVSPDETPFAGDLPRHTEELSACLESLFLSDLRLVPSHSHGVALAPVPVAPATRLRLRSCRQAKSVRFALSSLGDGAQLHGEALAGFPVDEPTRFRLVGLHNGEAELANLRAASSAQAAVLILPELRVTPVMRGAVQEFLAAGGHSLALVVAGSWHHAAGSGYVNRAIVLGARGESLWEHDKLREYRATADNVAHAPGFFAAVGIGTKGGFEGITRGATLEYCDTPVGRLCVAICVGFFHPDLQPVLAETRADYFLVPAMTSSAQDLHRRAEELVRHSAATLVANCGVVGSNAPSFSRKPIAGEAVEHAAQDLVFIDFILS